MNVLFSFPMDVYVHLISATRFGIALPKWIVERENSMWVSEVWQFTSLKLRIVYEIFRSWTV